MIKIVMKTAIIIALKTAIKTCDKIAIKTCDKTAIKTCDKKYVCNEEKEVSFLKISDPVKRDLIVKEYLEIKKNIRDNLLSERTREQQLQTDLSNIFKPITETQKSTTKEITEGLRPIKEGIDKSPQTSVFPAYPSIQAVEKLPEGEDPQYIGPIVSKKVYHKV